jgi:phytoene dehydrogenase-like protein
MPKLIVIGAGISGLSTGVHAQRCGFDVQIVEHADAPGGVCTAWKHGDSTIDGCIHWLMGARSDDTWHRFYDEIGALDGVELQRLDHYLQVPAWTRAIPHGRAVGRTRRWHSARGALGPPGRQAGLR